MDQDSATVRRGRSRLMTGIIAGVLAGLVAAIIGSLANDDPAGAQTNEDTSQTMPLAMGGRRHGGFGHKGFGMGAIHGEFVTRAPDGGYQTIATQKGEVTAVSASSITVKSEDGYSRTYTVDDNTLVNAGNDGIDDVKTGDDVRVTAIVAGGKASAVEIMDGTRIKSLRDRWRPGPRTTPSPSASTTSA